jgi:hypothetical protein
MLESRSVARVLPVSVLLSLVAGVSGGQSSEEAVQRLGAALADALEAREEGAGVEEAEEAVRKALKGLAGTRPAEDALRRTADLGRAVHLSQPHSLRDLRRGKVGTDLLRLGGFAGEGLEVAYRVPKDYDPRREHYPLVLVIPGEGEDPALHLRTHWLQAELLEQVILLAPTMPADVETWDEVVVAGRPGGLCHVLGALRVGLERFSVDANRVLIVGRGRGVRTALAAGNHAPQAFAGVIGLEGDAGDLGAGNFTNLPTWFAPGGEKAQAFFHELGAGGIANCRVGEVDEAGLVAWILAAHRSAFPERVELVVGKPFPTRAYWLRIAPSQPNARASAAIDRAGGLVLVSTVGASQLTLTLNDALVDLDRTLKVIVDGVTHTVDAPRRVPTLLELLVDGTSDAGCVYVAEVVIDLGERAQRVVVRAEPDAELEASLEAAGDDVLALWRVWGSFEAAGRGAVGTKALRRILRLAPDHAGARAALGFHGEPGAWFPTAAAFERYRRTKDEVLAAEAGHVLHREAWMHPDDRVYANRGWTHDPATGQWLSRTQARRLTEGWVRQDLDWIPPDEAAHRDDDLWRVDGEWVDLAVANRRHARLDAMWHVPSREVLLHTTVDRDVALRAFEPMGRAVEDLRCVLGAVPPLPLEVTLLRDEEQYDRLAFGAPDGRRPPIESAPLHLVHHAFLADAWFPRVDRKRVFRGMGVAYWDRLAPGGDLYGVHAVRLAVGFSYVEALDPSPLAVRDALVDGPGPDHHQRFEAEKALPRWLRLGAAVYAERYFQDDTVPEDGDPWWARHWSQENLDARGGLRGLTEVLECRIDPTDRDDGQRRLLEVGLVVAFVVDGGCAPVRAAHAELKRALAAGRLQREHVGALTRAVIENEDALRRF